MKRFYYSLTLIAALLLVVPAQAQVYFSPDASAGGDGSESNPYLSLSKIGQLAAQGETEFVLMDGQYLPETPGDTDDTDSTGLLQVTLNGEEGDRITIRAQNERQAWIKSDGVDPAVHIQGSYINVEGLRASSADNPEVADRAQPVLIEASHVTARHLLAHTTNRYENGAAVKVGSHSRDVLVEETEAYDFHRSGFEAFGASNVTFRRDYANGRGRADLEGGAAPSFVPDGGDSGYNAQASDTVWVENSISENANGFTLRAFFPPFLKSETQTKPFGNKYRYLGNISFNDNSGGEALSFFRPTAVEPRSAGLKDARIEDFLVVNPDTAFSLRSVADLTVENMTVLESGQDAIFLNLVGGASHSPADANYFMPCAASDTRVAVEGACTYRLNDVLLVDNSGDVLTSVPGDLPTEANDSLDFVLSNAVLSGNENTGTDEAIDDDAGLIRSSQELDVSDQVGTGEGECAVATSSIDALSGIGADGDDVGANIAYRYENGELTEDPLWTDEGFPHGAVIEGSPNADGNTAANVAERLGVNSECLPYKISSDVISLGGDAPQAPTLGHNFPNPITSATVIPYELSQTADVHLAVYDLLGRKVRTLVDRTQAAGHYRARVNMEGLSSGTYFYRIKAGDFSASQKMVVVR